MNLVNGMIVDGLGHVSLDSGAPGSALANNTLSQANIHQGKIKDTFKYLMMFTPFYYVTSSFQLFTTLLHVPKGQLISKGHFGIFKSTKETTIFL